MKPKRFTEEQIIGILKQAQAGMKDRRSLPDTWHQRCYLLQLAYQVWWHGSLRRQASEGARGGERQAEEAARRPDAGSVGAA